jgi:hypothetical protein
MAKPMVRTVPRFGAAQHGRLDADQLEKRPLPLAPPHGLPGFFDVVQLLFELLDLLVDLLLLVGRGAELAGLELRDFRLDRLRRGVDHLLRLGVLLAVVEEANEAANERQADGGRGDIGGQLAATVASGELVQRLHGGHIAVAPRQAPQSAGQEDQQEGRQRQDRGRHEPVSRMRIEVRHV